MRPARGRRGDRWVTPGARRGPPTLRTAATRPRPPAAAGAGIRPRTFPLASRGAWWRRVSTNATWPRPNRCSPPRTATWGCGGRATKGSRWCATAPTSTASTKRGRSSTARRPAASRSSARPSSTCRTPRSSACTSTTSRSSCRRRRWRGSSGRLTCGPARWIGNSSGPTRRGSASRSGRGASSRWSIGTWPRSSTRSPCWRTTRRSSSCRRWPKTGVRAISTGTRARGSAVAKCSTRR